MPKLYFIFLFFIVVKLFFALYYYFRLALYRMSPHNENKSIDGITGATLSVWAVNKVAALALYYHSQAVNPKK